MTSGSSPGTPRFAALRNRDARSYLIGAGVSMMGDAIEHVITYWVLWQTFHSAALVGFQSISHWIPFLVLSVWLGRMAARRGPGWMIVGAQVLFLCVSVAWGVLFATGSLEIWHACVLLILHGLAGASWGPAEQIALHRLVSEDELTGAVRLNATFRTAGVLCAPIIGAALLMFVGPTIGIFLNALCYLPLIVVVARLRPLFPPEAAQEKPTRADRALVRRAVLSRPALWGTMALSALAAATVGGMLQVSFATLADGLTQGEGGIGYGLLMFSMGFGSLLGGLLLEASGRLRPSLFVALVATAVSSLLVLVVTESPIYALTIAALFLMGAFDMASTSTGQAVVQLNTPASMRGPIFGMYSSFGSGFRVFGGIGVAVAGTWLAIADVIAIAAIAQLLGVAILAALVVRARRRSRQREAASGPSGGGVSE